MFSGKTLSDALALAEQLKEQTEAKEIEEMEDLFLRLSERYILFLQQKEQLNKPLQIQNPSSGIMKTTVSELLPHVVNHGHTTAAISQQCCGRQATHPHRQITALPVYDKN